MRIVSRIAAIIGAIALLVGVVLLGMALWEVYKQWFALSANRSASFPNPIPNTVIGTAVVAAGAFVLGLSIARGGAAERHPQATDVRQ